MADTVETMPWRRVAEVLLRIGDSLAQLDREAGRDAYGIAVVPKVVAPISS